MPGTGMGVAVHAIIVCTSVCLSTESSTYSVNSATGMALVNLFSMHICDKICVS